MGDVTLKNFLETHNLLPEIKPQVDVYFVTANEKATKVADELAFKLRQQGVKVSTSLSTGKFNQQLKQANKVNAKAAAIIGEDELAKTMVTLKDLQSGEQTQLTHDQFIDRFN